MLQQTLKQQIKIEGVGLHSGCPSVLILKPAAENTGIVFCREENGKNVKISARYNQVVDTRNCTCLGQGGVLISTIEHLMASLYAVGIDNAEIECSNQELPIMDGSGAIFYELLQKAAKTEQNALRKYLKVLRPVVFADDKGNSIELTPNNGRALHIRFDIEFPSKIVGHQTFDDDITANIFASTVAPSRTFCEKYQIDYLRSLGLIKGGSLDNAVVLDGENILNPDGFRVKNECVNHKVLDAVGDLYTSGYFVLADVRAYRTGHFHNNEVLKKLFADKENYEIVE